MARSVGRRTKFLLTGLAVSATLLPAAALAQAPEQNTTREGFPPTDGIIVKYEEGTSAAEQSTVLREENLDKDSDLGLINADAARVGGESVEAAIEDLESNPDVLYAEPDRIVRPMDYSDEPRFDELWGLNNTGQTVGKRAGKADVDINALEASGITRGSEDVVVAVIDDGADLSHPDLQGQGWTNPGEVAGNNVDDDGNGYVDDTNGWNFVGKNNELHEYGWDAHGTHVAGTIAGAENGEGVVGVAPGIKVMPVKFLSPWGGTLSDEIKAIEYAKREGAQIVNASFGYEGKPSRAEEEAIRRSGMLFVAAAGNGGADGKGDDNDANPNNTSYPASYDLSNVLSVAAADNQGRKPRFSNYGKRSVDISAPGVNILSSVPHTPEEPGLVLSSVGDSGKALTAGFGIEEIDGEEARASFTRNALGAVGHGSCPNGSGCLEDAQDVLLVDDDQSVSDPEYLADASPDISAAVESVTGTAPEVAETTGMKADGPSLSEMRGKTVVWSTGTSQAGFSDLPFNEFLYNLTRTDRSNLTQFLQDGGKLVLSGTFSMWGVEESSLVVDTLGVDLRNEYYTSTFEGASGTAFAGEGYTFRSVDTYSLLNTVIRPTVPSAAAQGMLGADSYESWDGTSMAAPHAAGAAALVASRYPNLADRPAALRKVILENGKPLPETRGLTATGRMVNANKAVFNGPSGR